MSAAIGPDIEGLSFIEQLGVGGYSEVFLYERQRPKMRVAVKVLTGSGLSETELAQFADEAETMAELADHPFIVQVFWTGTTADGRPYLVMKYYPPPNLGTRAETQRFSVAEVLRTAIQIGSAVETAHRAGIVHRDIKPANILISQYNEPGLTDFGIAGRTAETDEEEDLGVSIPWSPPEVLSGASNGSVQSDVYSLAASVWHLLAGRSPFEIRGGDNAPRKVMARVLRTPPPPTGRADVPASLERLLSQAMAKNPAHRPRTALEITRGFQAVEQELRFARTEVVVEDVSVVARAPEIATSPGATRMRASKPAAVAPTGFRDGPDRGSTKNGRPEPIDRMPGSSPVAPPGRKEPAAATWSSSAPPLDSPATRRRPTSLARNAPPVPHRTEDVPATVQRATRVGAGAFAEAPDVPAPPRHGRLRRSYVLAGVGVLIVAVPSVAVIATRSRGNGSDSPTAAPSINKASDQGGLANGGGAIAAPKVTAAYDTATKTLTFSWKGSAAGTTTYGYIYLLHTGTGADAASHRTFRTSVPTRTIDPSSVCITVGTVQADGSTVTGEQVCGTG